MHSISVQVQPHLSPRIPMDLVTQAFEAVAKSDRVSRHLFDSGHDAVHYYNYTFGADDRRLLWEMIRTNLYNQTELALHMRRASMAMCTGDCGWDDYLLLFHYDPQVPRASADVL